MIIKKWEFPLLRELVINNAGFTSAKATKFLTDQHIEISRASVIGTLNRWCDEGILSYVEERCQGGRRKVYRKIVNGEGFLALLRRELDLLYDAAYQSLQGSVSE